MVIDYSERRPVSKNRSKKQPVKLITLFIATVVFGIYSLGVASGWFLYKTLKKNPSIAPVQADIEAKKKKIDNPPTATPRGQVAGNPKSNETPLTFYQTLPKGEILTLGTGLNPSRSDKSGNTAIAPRKIADAKLRPQGEQAKAPVQKKAVADKDPDAVPAVPKTDKPGEKNSNAVTEAADKTPASNKDEKAKKRYTVQVASCNLKKEAEDIKTSMDRKGLPAYIVESKVPGKGTRYRVRLGSRLDLETANKIAAKAGNGAIPVSE